MEIDVHSDSQALRAASPHESSGAANPQQQLLFKIKLALDSAALLAAAARDAQQRNAEMGDTDTESTVKTLIRAGQRDACEDEPSTGPTADAAAVTTLRQQLLEERKRVAELVGAREEAEAAVTALSEQFRALAEEKAQMREALAKAKQRELDAGREFEQVQFASNSVQNRIKDLEQTSKALAQQCNTLDAFAREYSSIATREQAAIRSELLGARKIAEIANSKINKAQVDVRDHEMQARTHRAALDAAAQQVAELTLQNSVERAEYIRVAEHLQRMQSEKESIAQQCAQAQMQLLEWRDVALSASRNTSNNEHHTVQRDQVSIEQAETDATSQSGSPLSTGPRVSNSSRSM